MEKQRVFGMVKRSAINVFPPHQVFYPFYKYVLRKRFERVQTYRHQSASFDERSLKGFDEKRCIFIHIPKTGGVSLSHALYGNLGGGHRAVTTYYKVFSPREFREYFKFTVVRNPWDRLVSAYFFLKEGGFHGNDSEWQRNNLAEYRSFDEFVCGWVNHKNIYSYIHFVPQYFYINNFGKIIVDKIYKIEEIDDGIKDINKHLKLHITLPKRNQTRGREGDYRVYYSEKTKKIVERVYKNDIRIFGYSF